MRTSPRTSCPCPNCRHRWRWFFPWPDRSPRFVLCRTRPCAFRRRTCFRRPLLAVCRRRQFSFYRCPFPIARRALVNALLAENLSRDMYRGEAASAITARRDCRVGTPRHCARDILLLDRGGHCRPIVPLLDLGIPVELADQAGVQGRRLRQVGYLICCGCRQAPIDEFRFPLQKELGLSFERIRFAHTSRID